MSWYKIKSAHLTNSQVKYWFTSNFTLLSQLTEKVAALQLTEHKYNNLFWWDLPSVYKKFYGTWTSLVREYNYAILDIDRNKTVIVNAGRQAALKDEGTQSLGNSNLGKEAFERNQKKLQVQSWEICCISVALSKLHPHNLTKTENGYF